MALPIFLHAAPILFPALPRRRETPPPPLLGIKPASCGCAALKDFSRDLRQILYRSLHIMEPQGDIALIGLAVMGQNLILNMNDHGFTVVAYNRTTDKVDHFLANEAKGTKVLGAHSIAEMVAKLKRPRRVMMLVKAGKPVDEFIEQLVPALEPGDIIIDGAIPCLKTPIAGKNMWKARASFILVPAFPVAKKAHDAVPASCPAAHPLPGLMSKIFSRRSPPRSKAMFLAATGWVKPAPATT